jgi:hypothetical protein
MAEKIRRLAGNSKLGDDGGATSLGNPYCRVKQLRAMQAWMEANKTPVTKRPKRSPLLRRVASDKKEPNP